MNGDVAAVQAVRDEIVGELHSMRQAEQKQAAVCDASRREQRTYEAQQAEVEQSIDKVRVVTWLGGLTGLYLSLVQRGLGYRVLAYISISEFSTFT